MTRLAVAVSAEDHVQGDESAVLTLVEYGDFECPDCGAAYPVVKQLQRHFGSTMRLVYRNFPLERIHEMAEPAAEAAEFAAANGRFWEMHDALFEGQEELSEAMLVETATALQMDGKEAAAAIQNRSFRQRIDQDIAGGKQCGVHGTPTFFINGSLYTGDWEFDELSAAMQDAL